MRANPARRRTAAGPTLALLTGLLLPLPAAAAMAAVPAQVNADAVAVIVGNRNYDQAPEVKFAHNDARAVKHLVLEVLGYAPANVIDLRDATLAQMVAHFGADKGPPGKLANWLRPGRSDVFVFYSGHGVPGLEDRRRYLLPVDGDPNLAQITGYPLARLFANLGRLKARSVTLVLDSCFSGVTPAGTLLASASGVLLTPRPAPAPGGLRVLSAAAADQIASWDEEAALGLFTEHLLAGLYGLADGDPHGDGDGAVTISELGRYLDAEMSYQAQRRFSRRQKAILVGPADAVLARLVPGARRWRPSSPGSGGRSSRPATGEPSLEPIERHLVASGEAVVRQRPSADAKSLALLLPGEQVYVAGRLRQRNWYLVEGGGWGRGYVFAPRLRERSNNPAPSGRAGNPAAPTLAAAAGAVAAKVASELYGPEAGRLVGRGIEVLWGGLFRGERDAELSQDDRQRMARNLQLSLELDPSGSERRWFNPANGHGGAARPLRTFRTAAGIHCRDFRQTVQLGGPRGEAFGTACRRPDGHWRIIAD